MGKRWKSRVGWIVAGGVAVVASVIGFVGWRASRALQESAKEVRSEREIRVRVGPYHPVTNIGFEVVSAPAVFCGAARFQERLYIASASGLLEYDLGGKPLRQFVVGRDLPASAVIGLVAAVLTDSSAPELVVATAQDGLLLFNGRSFRQIYPEDAESRAITTVLPVGAGHLMIGTKKRGVLIYDGKQITALHPTLSNVYVQALAGTESDLWVGTLNGGVLHWHAGTTESFDESQGLPDRQVQSIAIAVEKVYVGTALGVAEFDAGKFSRVLANGVLVTALLPSGENLLVGSEDQGVVNVALSGRRRNISSNGAAEMEEVRQLFKSGEDTYVVTRNGLFQKKAHGLAWESVLQPQPSVLSDHNISALAVDRSGRLWVGYFDRGLDMLGSDSGRTTHVENEHVFCVNRIWPDARTGTVAVGTANGLVRFDAAGSEQQVLTKADGLISDHVTDVVAYGEGLAIGTPAGVTFLDATGARSMYAFQGLVNNHVYALAAAGEELMVGTLGGLSMIEKGDIRTNYTAGASGLKHNWITAVVRVGDEWMVGTYGAGVIGMDSSGRFHTFEKATAEMEINPNAMLATERHVFAGTLGNGLYIYDRQTERWVAVRDGLPSENVTALAESGGFIYVGTDNGLVRIQEQKLNP